MGRPRSTSGIPPVSDPLRGARGRGRGRTWPGPGPPWSSYYPCLCPFPVDGPVDGGDTRSDTGGDTRSDTGGDTGADTSVAEMSLGQLMEAVGQQVRLELASHTNAPPPPPPPPPAPTVGGGAQDGSVEGVPVAGPTDVGRTLPQSGSGEIPCMHSIPACTLFGGS